MSQHRNLLTTLLRCLRSENRYLLKYFSLQLVAWSLPTDPAIGMEAVNQDNQVEVVDSNQVKNSSKFKKFTIRIVANNYRRIS